MFTPNNNNDLQQSLKGTFRHFITNGLTINFGGLIKSPFFPPSILNFKPSLYCKLRPSPLVVPSFTFITSYIIRVFFLFCILLSFTLFILDSRRLIKNNKILNFKVKSKFSIHTSIQGTHITHCNSKHNTH